MPAPLQPKAAILPKSERQKIAAAFLKGAQWSVLTMRGTRVQDKPAPAEDVSRVTMRVFAKGCPAAALREVLEALAADTPVASFVADAVAQPGEWHHKAAWWARDAQASKSGDATQTIFREMSDGPVTETNVVDDGCGSRTTIRFEWDAPEVEDYSSIAHAGEQGFSVRIAGVNRDPETELFSYYVTTTERKTQYLSEHKTNGDAFTDVYASDYMGLRGTVAAPTDDEGVAVAVPTPGADVPGTMITNQWGRNLEDCTLNAQIRKQVAKPGVTAEESCARDLFSERDSTMVRAQAAKLGHAPAAAGGVITTHQSQLRSDQTYDNQVSVDTEKPVSAAQETRQEDLFERQASITDRNQAAPLGASPAPTGGVLVQHSWDKTPGGLYNNRQVTTTEKPVSAAQESLQEDLFTKKDGVTDRNQAAPLGAAPAPAGGVVVDHSWDKTPGGLYNNRKMTTTEKPVSAAQESRQEDLFSTQVSVADRNQVAPLGAVPSPAGGVTVQHNWNKTPGGLYDNRKVTTTEKPVTSAQVTESGDASHVQVVTQDKSVADPGGLASPNSEPGVLKTRQRAKTPGGLCDVQNTEVTFIRDREVVAPATSGVKTYAEEQSEQVIQNATAAVPVPAFVEGQPLVDVRSAKTGANLYDVSKKTRTPIAREMYYTTTDDKGTTYYCVFLNQAQTWRPTWFHAYATNKTFSPGVPNEFGLISGSATRFVALRRDDDVLDAYPVGWREYPMLKEVSHTNSTGPGQLSITTRYVPYTVYEYYTLMSLSWAGQILETKLAQLNVEPTPPATTPPALGAASTNVTMVSLRSGQRLYKITIVGNLDTSAAHDAVVSPA